MGSLFGVIESILVSAEGLMDIQHTIVVSKVESTATGALFKFWCSCGDNAENTDAAVIQQFAEAHKQEVHRPKRMVEREMPDGPEPKRGKA